MGSIQKPRIFLHRDLGGRHGKGIEPDAMNRAFSSLTDVGSHEEPVSGDVNSEWLSDRHATGCDSHDGHSEKPFDSIFVRELVKLPSG